MKKLFTLLLVSILSFASVSAEATKRMGGGKSMGQQNTTVTKQAQPPAQNTVPAKPQTAPATPAAAPAATPATPWGAMLGGMAAGLGLAWLAHSLGFGEAFGNIMLAMLIGLTIMIAVGWYIRSRQNKNLREEEISVRNGV